LTIHNPGDAVGFFAASFFATAVFFLLVMVAVILGCQSLQSLTFSDFKRLESKKSMAAKLEEGNKAPDFTVRDENGDTVRLKDLRGKKVVLYFYPKDGTPGCTKEACSFRDSFSKFKKRGIEVLGVSLDSEKSHQKFIKKFDLPFRLLADTDRAISEACGTYGEKKFMGRTYMGNNRMTFLIDEKGKIKKIFNKVKPEDHADEVLKAFDE
jgi:peroxiredoxin Q/BCP